MEHIAESSNGESPGGAFTQWLTEQRPAHTLAYMDYTDAAPNLASVWVIDPSTGRSMSYGCRPIKAARGIVKRHLERMGHAMPDPKTLRLCIDADCPECGHPERFREVLIMDGGKPGLGYFGCNKCDYTSNERNA